MTADWLVADDVWWGRGVGRAALRIVDEDVVGTPVPVTDVPVGAAVRRLPGTLLPGLCDSHVHSALVDLGVVRAGGIAAVWDLGGVPAKVAELRRRSELGASRLPRVTMAGAFLTAPGGYPGDRAWAPAGCCREIRSVHDAADAVAEAHALGATLIKVTAHASGPMLSGAAMRTIVSEAHIRGLPVIVHAEGPGTVAAAVDAGADVLAHTPWTESLDPGLARTAAEQMTWLSTLDIHGWGVSTPERDTAVGNLRLFLRYGGNVRYGTDLGNGPLPPGVNTREIRALQVAGLTPERILDAMTGDRSGVPPCWVPGGLDLDPVRFADVLATARVVGPELRPRGL
jgi:imidazolonepropionase-like amidohydrolase